MLESRKILAGWLFAILPKGLCSFNIHIGDNFIGREGLYFETDILIQHDPFISRCHANFKAVQTPHQGRYFLILDNGKGRNGNPSTNGTFVNFSQTRLTKTEGRIVLHDDIIHMGQTYFQFKSKDKVSQFISASVSAKIRLNQITKTGIL